MTLMQRMERERLRQKRAELAGGWARAAKRCLVALVLLAPVLGVVGSLAWH